MMLVLDEMMQMHIYFTVFFFLYKDSSVPVRVTAKISLGYVIIIILLWLDGGGYAHNSVV